MEKNIVDKKFVELLESYDYVYSGNFYFVFDFERYKNNSELTIQMLNGCEDNDREYAYCISLYYFGDSGKVNFQVQTDGYSIAETELDFFSQIAEDKKKIMAMYNEVA